MEILERDIATKTTEYMFSMVFSNLDKHQPWSLGITIMRTVGPASTTLGVVQAWVTQYPV